MTIWISREVPLFNFECLDVLCPWIVHSSEKLWPFEFLNRFRCSISRVSIYYAPKSHIRVKSYDHLIFSRAFCDQFRALRYIMRLKRTSVWKVLTIWISRNFLCSICSVSICDVPESDIQVKSYIWISWELSLFNLERLDILCTWIGHVSEKLCPFEYLGSFRWSISSI